MTSPIPQKENTIEGTTLYIHDLTNLDTITAQLNDQPDLASRIKHIYIINADLEEPEPEPEPKPETNNTSAAQNPAIQPSKEESREIRIAQRIKRNATCDARAALLTAPITHILQHITSHSGSLETFSWASESTAARFTRPHVFWSALWKHSESLVFLRLEFWEHEVRELPQLPEHVSFGRLERLEIDAGSAHGCDGRVLDDLFRRIGDRGSRLRELKFEWPGCDLDTCQIKNISWEYGFGGLERLSLRGWDFAPGRFEGFLEECGEVKWFSDGVDGPYDNDDNEGGDDGNEREHGRRNNNENTRSEQRDIGSSVLPKLKGLYFDSRVEARSLQGYFSARAARKIEYLAICQDFRLVQNLHSLVEAGSAAGTVLKRLDIFGGVEGLRPEVPDSESDSDTDSESDKKQNEDEDNRDDKTGVNNTASKKKHIPPPPQPRLPGTLHTILSLLQNLEKLGISLSSTHTTYINRKTGEETHPPPMTSTDLISILALLPSQSNIRVLKLWDTRGEILPQDMLDDFPNVPESLEYVIWQAERVVVYRLVRESGSGKVRTVEYEGEDVWRGEGDGKVDVWGDREVMRFA